MRRPGRLRWSEEVRWPMTLRPTIHPACPTTCRRRPSALTPFEPLIDRLACGFARSGRADRDDLRQVGYLGLLRGMNNRGERSGAHLEAFLVLHIRGAMLHYLRDAADPVRLPRRLRQTRDWRAWSLRLRPLDALAEHQLPADPRGEGWSTLLKQERQQQVRQAMETLDPLERRCVEQVVLAGQSLRQVGREEGVSAMTVHRRLRRALDQLRPRLAPLAA